MEMTFTITSVLLNNTNKYNYIKDNSDLIGVCNWQAVELILFSQILPY